MKGLSITFFLLMFIYCEAYAQSPDSRPEFEVASVKPAQINNRGTRIRSFGGPGSSDPLRYTGENLSLSNLVLQAYKIMRYQLSGPAWLDTERFDIAAKVPDGANRDQFRLMLQRLLEDRFKLKIHWVRREIPIYELVVAKEGPRLKELTDTPHTDGGVNQAQGKSDPSRNGLDRDGYPELPAGKPMMSVINGRARRQAINESMEQLADILSGQVGRPVKDETGLKGRYSFVLSWVISEMNNLNREGSVPSMPGASPVASDLGTEPGPNIFAALSSQLGLKLNHKTGTVDVIVVDHVEKSPAEN